MVENNMAGVSLSQTEADALRAMEKHRTSEEQHDFPVAGARVSIPLLSADKREQFFLDVNRSRLDLRKITCQNRARQVFILVRLDIAGPPHRNPDGEEIPCPHLHLYREGFGDKWAQPAPADMFPRMDKLFLTLQDFMRYCNITLPPQIEEGLFE